MLICSVTFVFMFGNDCFCPASWQWQVGTAAILLAWVDLINLIRQLQVFDIGMDITLAMWHPTCSAKFVHFVLINFVEVLLF